MFELIDASDMKQGNMYFVKNLDYIGEIIFMKYEIAFNGKPIATFRYPYLKSVILICGYILLLSIVMLAKKNIRQN